MKLLDVLAIPSRNETGEEIEIPPPQFLAVSKRFAVNAYWTFTKK
jgi:hypothetical protein